MAIFTDADHTDIQPALVRLFLIHGFHLFDIVLTFEFEHNITIKKMAIFTDVNYIDIQPALVYRTSPQKKLADKLQLTGQQQ